MAGKLEVNEAIKSYITSYPTPVDINIIAYGKSIKHCNSQLKASTKTPISPSSRWLFKISCPGKWRAMVSVKTKVMIDIPFSLVDLSKGDIINTSDILFKKQWFSKRVNVIQKNRNYVAKTPITKNTIIYKSRTSPLHLIKKNTFITAIVSSPNINVKISVKALANGQKHDIIPVINTNSGKRLMVKILSANTAILE